MRAEPMLLNKAFELLNDHRTAGDTYHDDRNARCGCRACGSQIGIRTLVGEEGIVDECYKAADGESPFSGRQGGPPSSAGASNTPAAQAADTWFYSDSHNDLPCSRPWVIPWPLTPTAGSAHMPNRRGGR